MRFGSSKVRAAGVVWAVAGGVVMGGVGGVGVGVAMGAPVEFTHRGYAHGTLNGVAFTDHWFTITGVGDTNDRQSYLEGLFINHRSASITIEGLGTFAVLEPTRTFVNTRWGTAGFSQAGADGIDLFGGPEHESLRTWDMRSSIGPVEGWGAYYGWAFMTSGGSVHFDAGASRATFAAVVVPAPAGLPLLGLLAARRRRR